MYNRAIATSNTNIILNAVVVLFVMDMDEYIFSALEATNARWTKHTEEDTEDTKDQKGIDGTREEKGDAIDEMKNEIAIQKEQIEFQQEQNAARDQKIASLEDELRKMEMMLQKMIELGSSEIAYESENNDNLTDSSTAQAHSEQDSIVEDKNADEIEQNPREPLAADATTSTPDTNIASEDG